MKTIGDNPPDVRCTKQDASSSRRFREKNIF